MNRAIAWVRARLGPVSTDTNHASAYGPALDAARDATVLAVHDVLHAAPVRFSRVLEVTFTAQDPLIAAAAVNNAMDIYIKDQFTAKAAAVHRATAWMEERATALRADVRKAEDRIAAYRADHNFAQGMHAGLDAEKISNLNDDLIRARADLAAADARVDAARGGAGTAAQAAIAASVVPLRTSLEQLTAQYQAQSSRLGANHPDAQSSKRQVDDARRAVDAEIARVVAATEQDRRAAKERVTILALNLQSAKQEADQETKDRIPLNAMERDAEAARAQLLAMLERIQQTAQQHALETSEAHEISLALPPRVPSWPKPAPMMAGAVAAGILLGLMLVYVLHLTDSTLHGGEDVRAMANLPCFALVPELSRRELRSAPIDEFVVRRPLTAFAEQIRAVRAGLWVGVDRPRVVAITAARPAEGKSVLALSLARSAALSGEKVLLIDCDMRRPSLAHRLRVDNSTGLSDVLRGTVKLQDVLHGDRFGGSEGGMHFVPAGQPGGDTFGLFMGPEMARLLTEARREYALIVLDSPPVQAITEARVLAAVADATILCVRWRATPRDVVSYALEMLEHAHAQVTGIVLTRVDPGAHVRSGYADAEVYHRRYKAYFPG
jgi:capsular exopolysaccharide synthesis family protein